MKTLKMLRLSLNSLKVSYQVCASLLQLKIYICSSVVLRDDVKISFVVTLFYNGCLLIL